MNNPNIRKFFQFLAVTAAGVSVGAVPLQAWAQEGLDEVIVTARKREENLQDVPVAITVFTGTALQEAGIMSTRTLYENTPGLNYDTGFDQNAGTPAIRGVVANEIATYRQKVTTFLDGMPILGQQGSVPFTAIQQVEVLRGPQSAAFGRSTFGGAINFTTRDPGDSLEAEFSLDVGSDSLLNIGALLSGPIAGDTLSGLIAVGSNQVDGESDWVTVVEKESLGGEKAQNVLAKLLYEPNENLTIELRYKWLDVDNEQTARAFLPLDNPNRQWHPDAVIPPPFPNCGVGVPAPSCAIVGDVSAVKSVYDYNYAATGIDNPFVRNNRDRFEIDGTYDFSGGISLQVLGFTSDEFYERATDANLTNDANGFERDPTNIDETYGEVRLTSPSDQRFRWGVGASYYDYEFETVLYMSRANYDLGPTGMGNQRFSESATNTGVFFNLTADLNDSWTASLEGRSQSDDVAGNAVQAGGGFFKLGQTTDAFLPRVSLTWSPNQDTTVYAQIAKGNNPAGVNIGAVDPALLAAYDAYPGAFPTDVTNIAFFKEEKVLSYEVGIKGSLNDRVSYAVNVYSLEWENYTQPFNLNFEPVDFIDTTPDDGIGDTGTPYEGLDFGPGRSFLGAGNVTGKGIELESRWAATDNLRLSLAASYIDITYDNGACSTLPIDFGVPPDSSTQIGLPCVSVAGNRIATQPKLSGSFSIEYSRPVGNDMEWFTRWNTRFSSSQYISEMNLAEIGSYSISDLRTGLSRNNWRAELYVTNLFDDDTPQGPNYFFDGRIPGPPPFVQNINYTDRRSQAIGARFSYSYGN